MGLFIIGELLPQDITQKQWERAYEEVLQLVNAYDFLDIIRNKDKYTKYGLMWCYAEKSREREIGGHIGVGIYGAYSGCISAEDQILYRDLNCYTHESWLSDKKIKPEQNVLYCHDALIGRLFDIEELEIFHDYRTTIFGNKTQGYPHHVPLLSIGLLLEDRLGKAFTVHGDITRGQIKAAIKWANTILDEPISLPCILDNAELLNRLQVFVPRERLLESFTGLTFCEHDEAMYQFLVERFSEAELFDYWGKKLSDCIPGTLGANRFFRDYFSMTDDLALLTKVCSGKYMPEEFAKQLASTRVFENGKNTYNPVESLSHDSDREIPETIETTMGKMFALLGGSIPYNNAVERYIPLEQGLRDITLAFRDLGETDLDFAVLLRNSIEDSAPKSVRITENLDIFNEISDKINEQAEKVDIFDPENLVFYEANDVIRFDIKANLRGIREFVDSNKKEAKQNYLETYADEELADKKFVRMAIIVKRCTRLLPKYIWDMFEQKIVDDDFFFALLTLHLLKSDTLPISYYVKGLLYNPILFEQVLLSDDKDYKSDNTNDY